MLIVVHQRHSTPGRIGVWLRDRGYRLDIRRPRFGDPLPQTMAGHAGAIIFGGPMSANDPDEYVRREIDWIAVPLREGAPFLGVCLGAQMLARHLGSRVGVHADEHVEIGYFPIEPTEKGKAVCPWPRSVYQWHREGFELPEGAELIARGQAFENQAFTYGPAAAGVQFHPEITYAMVNRWTSHRPDRLELKGARPRRDHFHGHFAHSGEVGRWLDGFMTRWLDRALTKCP